MDLVIVAIVIITIILFTLLIVGVYFYAKGNYEYAQQLERRANESIAKGCEVLTANEDGRPVLLDCHGKLTKIE